MQLSLRQQHIMERARLDGNVTVDALVQAFDVTPQTIRRDLNALCSSKLLVRAHGGAILASGTENVEYEQRKALFSDEKQKIGELCASHIPDNSSLFINIGTTTEAVARALLQHRNLMVVTNNLNVANILLQNASFEIIIAGGVLRHRDQGITGEATIDFMKQFKLDFAVIGTSALDDQGALLDFDYREARVTQAILGNARKRFLVSDKGKLERTAPVRVAHVSQLTDVFMDACDSNALATVCHDHQINLHTVQNHD